MTELIQQLQAKAGLTAEQAQKSLLAIKEYVIEKYPMLAGAAENIFAGASAVPKAEESTQQQHSVLDRISDYIPGQTGEKIENFAKTAADKAEDVFDNVKGKVGGFFHNSDEKKV